MKTTVTALPKDWVCHKEPLTELRTVKKAVQSGPVSIKNLTAGIALFIIAAAIVVLRLVYINRVSIDAADFNQTIIYLFVAVVFFAIGISRLLRGILQRKAEQQNLLDGNKPAVDSANTASK